VQEPIGDDWRGVCLMAQPTTGGNRMDVQTHSVFIRGALPGCVRVAEVDVDVGVDGHLFPLAHLRALVPGQRGAQQVGQCLDLGRQSIPHEFGGVAVG
jgi:hypothetical protein